VLCAHRVAAEPPMNHGPPMIHGGSIGIPLIEKWCAIPCLPSPVSVLLGGCSGRRLGKGTVHEP
jgi:hypothetical protein